jgi:predicted nucleotidyltransferase
MNTSSSQQTIQQSVSTLKQLSPLFRKFGVARVWLFGSRAQGNAGEGSDWDLMVEFSSPPGFDDFMGLKIDLEDQLKARIDLLSKTACPPRFFAAIKEGLLNVA